MTAEMSTGVADPGRLGGLITGYNGTQVVRVFAKLAIADHLAGSPRTAKELAVLADAAPGPLSRLLSAAALYGLVSQGSDGRFTLTPTGGLLRTELPGSMRALAIGFTSAPLWQAFGQLGEVVRHDQSVEATLPGGIWAYFRRNPEDATWFARAMGRFTADLITQIAALGYTPPDAGRMVDVGGGSGALLAHLVGSTPAARGVLFDGVEAMADAPDVLARAGVADRVDVVPGDFFGSVPAGDVHVLCNILHDWSDEQALEIVTNCHRAGRPGGTLVVIGLLLPAGPEPSVAHLMDLQMMVMMAGGRERTLAETRALVGSVGYELRRDVPIPGHFPAHILEFRR